MDALDASQQTNSRTAVASVVASGGGAMETDDTLDPDIDVAAEQIVAEFAQHLHPDAAIFDHDDVLNDTVNENNDNEGGGEEVGVMSHSLAAGGFEELIVAFDEDEDDDEMEEVEEEIIDESYEEEEITEEELVDPNIVEEVDPTEQSMGGGGSSGGGVHNQPTRDDDNDDDDKVEEDVALPNPVSNDPTTTAGGTMESESVVHVIPPEDTNAPVEVLSNVNDHETTIPIEPDSALDTASSSVSGSRPVVDIPMELSPTSHASQKSYSSRHPGTSGDGAATATAIAAALQASDVTLLRGDALLGEMSELSAAPSSVGPVGSGGGSMLHNKSERSTTSAISIKSIKSLLSSKSNKSNTSQQQQQQQQQHSSVPPSDAAMMEHSTTSRISAVGSTTSATSQRTQTAASVATVPVSNVMDPLQQQQQQRYVPGRDPAGTAAGASPLVVMHEGEASTSEVLEEEYTEEYEEEEVIDAAIVEETRHHPTTPANESMTKPGVTPNSVAPQVQSSAVHPPPVTTPPTIVPIAMAASALPHSNESDVEMGHAPPKTTVTEAPKASLPTAKQESATENTAPKVETKAASAVTPTATTTEPSKRRHYLVALICFLVILLVVILSVVLTRDDNDKSLDIPIAPSPTAVAPSPIASPVSLAWVESIPAVGGPPGSGFASAISLDNNIVAVGAPLYNETGYGAVFTTLLSDAGTWELLPLLLGEQAGDDFGAAVDVQGGRLIVGAPMRPIADTTTPAGAAYVYSYSPTVGAWELEGFALRSGEGIFEANGEFGASVSLGLAASPRVAIGAPKSNPNAETLEAGRVYTFEAVDTQWNALETAPIFGKAASDWFGYSVDMSDDGSRLLVGAPGNALESTGYIQIYEWTESQWILRFEDVGSVGESFGSSVVSLSETGDLIAAGGPGYLQGSGRVAVYQRQASGEYMPLGQPIVGASGDRIGSTGSLSGGNHDKGKVILTSTATGSVKTYTLNPIDSTWNERFEALQFDGGVGGVSVKYSEENGLLVGNTNTEQVFLFDDQPGAIATSAPITTPVETGTPVVEGSAVVPSPNSTETPNVGSPTLNSTEPPVDVPINSTATATVAPAETWILTGSSFTPNTDGSAFGTSVSLATSTMVVGAPATLQNGAVFLYQNNIGTWETIASGQLFGTEASGLFGASVDVVDGFVVVGAPGMVAAGTTTPAGAVLAYSVASGQWVQVGEALRGDAGVYAAGEQFGASVSTANAVRRVVVGAPGSSLDIVAARGRVYVYEFNDATSSWAMMLDVPGVATTNALGTSVDMSQDGTQFVVGAPGGGYAELYEYNGSNWISAYLIQDATGFGSAVAILGPSTFAVGHPGANGGQGRVTIFQGSAGVYQQLGPVIDGEAGDQLGDTGAISGGSDAALISVVLGTANGTIKRFDYDSSSSTWIQRGDTINTAFGSSLNAVAVSSRSIVVGGPLAAEIYELQ